jgi:hypothetical protein
MNQAKPFPGFQLKIASLLQEITGKFPSIGREDKKLLQIQ